MTVHAIVHTVGIVLNKQYYALELSFVDVTGYEQHFHIQSPVPYSYVRKYFPHSRPDVIMTMENATPYHQVLQFLQARFIYLKTLLPDVTFGCKGGSYQANVLRDAHIPTWINLDLLGLPSLQKLSQMYDVISTCPWHKVMFKCSRTAVYLIQRYLLEQQMILPFSQHELVSEVHNVAAVGNISG